MTIETKILSLLNESARLGKSSMQIQNIDLLLMRSGESEFLGNFLLKKINEMLKDDLIFEEKKNYSITSKGLAFLQNQE
jgi:predicted transcriptional regulator